MTRTLDLAAQFDGRVGPAFLPTFTPDDARHDRSGERRRFERVCRHQARADRPHGDALLELYAKHNRQWIAEEYGVKVWQVSKWLRDARGW